MAGTVRIAILANAAQAKAELDGIGGKAAGIGQKFAKFRAPAGAALAAIAVGAKSAVGSASDLAETVSKSNQIFGSNAAEISKWAGGAARNLGLSKEAALESAAGFGNMFTQLGFSGDAAAALSKTVVQTSADLGSFNNLPTSDVADRMSAAFRGEYDSLQALVPNINAARVEHEAMAASGKKSAKDLTAQEKATAVLSIVQKDGAKAMGDFARTQAGAANQSKIAAASAADLSASLGQAVLPAYTAVVTAASAFLGMLNQHTGAVTAVVAVVAVLAAAVLAVSAAQTIANTVMAVTRGVTIAYTAAQWLLNAALTANPIGIIVVAIGLLVAGLVLAWRNSETFRKIVTGAFTAVKAAGVAAWTVIKSSARAVWSAITGFVRTSIAVIKTTIAILRANVVAVWNAIKRAASAVWSFIARYVRTQIAIARTAVNVLKSAALAVWSAIKGGASRAFSAVKSAVTGAINAARTKFGQLRTKASEVVTRIKSLFSASTLISAGRRLIAGLAAGVQEKIDDVVGAVRRAVQRIKDLLPGSPIKDGPLRSWNNGGAGRRLMDLLRSGIAAGASGVERELGSVLDAIAAPVVEPRFSLGGASIAGLGAGGSVTNLTVNLRVAPGVTGAQVGADFVRFVRDYERTTGRKVLAA